MKKIGAKALKNKVATEYMRKGVSAQQAERIAGGVVRKVGVKKYGAKRFNNMIRKAK